MRKLLAATLFVTGCGMVDGLELLQPELSAPNRVAFDASRFGNAPYVPGELIIKLQPHAASSFQGFMRKFSLTPKKQVLPGAHLVVARDGTDVAALAAHLSRQAGVAYAEPNFIARIPEQATGMQVLNFGDFFAFDGDPAEPNDEHYKQQYAPQITHAPQGWAVFDGDPNFILSIVDTGIDASHPDLADKVIPGYDAVDGDNDARDGHGHGTHCAGIAAAMTNNGLGIAGISPKNKIMPVRVLDDNGSGSYAGVAEGMIWAADHGAKVISMSLGGPSSAKVIDDAVKYCLSKDTMIVAAMGNDYGRKKSYPAAVPGVMAIGSTDSNDKRSNFSNYGDWISVGAPGSRIFSTVPTYGSAMGKDYGFASGTSMATPAAAGLASLVRAKFPNLDYKGTRALIEKTADDVGKPGFDEEYGHGRINVENAMKAAGLFR